MLWEGSMAKRFTCTDKWKKRFIKELPLEYKLLWFYILDDCDHAGIWHIDFEVAGIRIDAEIDPEIAANLFSDKIHIFDNGDKWFIPSFIDFQYNILNENVKAHKSVIDRLEKYDLLTVYKQFTKSYVSIKDKDKDKDKDKESEKQKFMEFVYLTENEVEKLIKEYGRKKVDEFVARLNDYIGSKGKKYKSHYHTIKNWIRMDADKAKTNKPYREKVSEEQHKIKQKRSEETLAEIEKRKKELGFKNHGKD